MKKLRIAILSLTLVVFGLIAMFIYGYYQKFAMTRDWFNGVSNAHLTGLKLEGDGITIVVTKRKVLLQIESAIKNKTALPAGEGAWSCTVYPQINGSWGGEMQITCGSGQTGITLGMPSSFGTTDYEYASLNVGLECSEAICTAISGAYNLKE